MTIHFSRLWIALICTCVAGSTSLGQDGGDLWFTAAAGVGRPSAPPPFYDFWSIGISTEVGLLSRWSGSYYRGVSMEIAHFPLSSDRYFAALSVPSASSRITGGSATLVSAGYLVGGFGDGPWGSHSISGDIGMHVMLSAVGSTAASYSGYAVDHPGRMDVLLGVSIAGRAGNVLIGPWRSSLEAKLRVALVGRDRANSDFVTIRLFVARSIDP